MHGWEFGAHARSPRSVPAAVTEGEQLPYRSMADNACRSCHDTHTAPYRQWLLYDRPSRLCLDCHDGLTAESILPVVDQRYGHRINKLFEVRRGPEDRLRVNPFVECVDCHNPHAVASDLFGNTRLALGAQGPMLPPAMVWVSGVSIAGVPVDPATAYYEVCFKCHGDRPVRVPNRIFRQEDTLGNVRRQFQITAASAHPVAYPARNTSVVPSLSAQYRTRLFVSCQDCHNNPNGKSVGGTEADGPHTSRFQYLLVRRYETRDFTMESPQAYALCYECHDRNSILGDQSFSLHRVHIVRGRSPCSACHTAHGVTGTPAEHSNLINFDLAIVSGRRQFIDTGRYSGTCTLTCHGVEHVNFTYGQ